MSQERPVEELIQELLSMERPVEECMGQGEPTGQEEPLEGATGQGEPTGQEDRRMVCSGCYQMKPISCFEPFGSFCTCSTCRKRNMKASRRKYQRLIVVTTRDRVAKHLQDWVAKAGERELIAYRKVWTRPLTIDDYLNNNPND